MSASSSTVIAELASKGPHRSEVGRKQLTLALGELYIASTTITAKPRLVWEAEKGYPRYYIPTESLHNDIKARLSGGSKSSKSGVTVETVETITGTGNNSQAVIERLTVGPSSTTWVRFLEGPLKGFVRFERNEIDDWFEDGAIFAGIKNPHKRIDTATVSRHIAINIDGEKVAETNVAVLLNETGLNETYYIPATSILNWGVVEKSDLRTACPYKGEAWYLSLTIKGKRHDNIIWYYQYPTHESAAVGGLLSFYNKENVDIIVDGVKI